MQLRQRDIERKDVKLFASFLKNVIEILRQGKHVHNSQKLIKGSSDLKKVFFKILVFPKMQLSLKTKVSEKVPYHRISKKSLYHTCVTWLIKYCSRFTFIKYFMSLWAIMITAEPVSISPNFIHTLFKRLSPKKWGDNSGLHWLLLFYRTV